MIHICESNGSVSFSCPNDLVIDNVSVEWAGANSLCPNTTLSHINHNTTIVGSDCFISITERLGSLCGGQTSCDVSSLSNLASGDPDNCQTPFLDANETGPWPDLTLAPAQLSYGCFDVDVPGAPVDVSAISLSSSSATVIFGPPVTGETERILKYTAYYWEPLDGLLVAVETSDTHSFRIELDDLYPLAEGSKYYTVWITASSLVGEGPNSALVTFKLDAADCPAEPSSIIYGDFTVYNTENEETEQILNVLIPVNLDYPNLHSIQFSFQNHETCNVGQLLLPIDAHCPDNTACSPSFDGLCPGSAVDWTYTSIQLPFRQQDSCGFEVSLTQGGGTWVYKTYVVVSVATEAPSLFDSGVLEWETSWFPITVFFPRYLTDFLVFENIFTYPLQEVFSKIEINYEESRYNMALITRVQYPYIIQTGILFDGESSYNISINLGGENCTGHEIDQACEQTLLPPELPLPICNQLTTYTLYTEIDCTQDAPVDCVGIVMDGTTFSFSQSACVQDLATLSISASGVTAELNAFSNIGSDVSTGLPMTDEDDMSLEFAYRNIIYYEMTISGLSGADIVITDFFITDLDDVARAKVLYTISSDPPPPNELQNTSVLYIIKPYGQDHHPQTIIFQHIVSEYHFPNYPLDGIPSVKNYEVTCTVSNTGFVRKLSMSANKVTSAQKHSQPQQFNQVSSASGGGANQRGLISNDENPNLAYVGSSSLEFTICASESCTSKADSEVYEETEDIVDGDSSLQSMDDQPLAGDTTVIVKSSYMDIIPFAALVASIMICGIAYYLRLKKKREREEKMEDGVVPVFEFKDSARHTETMTDKSDKSSGLSRTIRAAEEGTHVIVVDDPNASILSKKLDSVIDTLKQELNVLHVNLKQKDTELAEAQWQKADLQAEKNTLSKKLLNTQIKSKELAATCELLKIETENMRSELEETKELLDRKNEDLTSVVEKLAQSSAVVRSVQVQTAEDINEEERQRETKETQTDEDTVLIEVKNNWKEEVKALNEKIAQIGGEIQIKDEEFSKIQVSQSEQEDNMQKLKNQVLQSQSEKQELQNRLDATKDETHKIKADLAAAQLALEHKGQELTKIIESFSSVQTASSSREDALMSEIKRHEERQKSNETDLHVLKEELVQVKAEKAGYLSELASIKKENFEMKDLIPTLQQNARTAQLEAANMAEQQAVDRQLRERAEFLANEERKERTATTAQLIAMYDTHSKETHRLKVLEEKIAEDASSNAELQKIIKQKDEEIIRLNTEVNMLRTRAQEWEKGNFQKQESNIRDLEEIAVLQGDNLILKARLESYENDRTAEELQKQILDLKKTVKETEEKRRQMHNLLQELKGNIRVYCRVRPFLPNDNVPSNAPVAPLAKADGSSITLRRMDINGVVCEKHMFVFDQSLSPSAGQDEVFHFVRDFVRSSLDGYHSCIFTYGQTGSGKTHTIQGTGTGPMRGIIPRAFEEIAIYKRELNGRGWNVDMYCTFLEIYNETIKDLLWQLHDDPDSVKNRKREIKQNEKGEIFVSHLTEVPMDPTDLQKADAIMEVAARHRSVGSTKMNTTSSRSHSIFTLHLQVTDEMGTELQGKLNLADLAGSERIKKSGASGERLEEAKHINKSLSSLSDVFLAVANGNSHVPYRNSKLTHLLQPSLSGDGKAMVIINLSPTQESYFESLSSLRFGSTLSQLELGKAKQHKHTSSSEDLLESSDGKPTSQVSRRSRPNSQASQGKRQTMKKNKTHDGALNKTLMDHVIDEDNSFKMNGSGTEVCGGGDTLRSRTRGRSAAASLRNNNVPKSAKQQNRPRTRSL
eukprot:CAMPEP_0117749586 /NCGR_PEP_ID=MMETSP0947-20121206/9819_1 /TAXON_ID=44440 /ORGANISM="Chattonella subsalsa, Strain CCMP2191" /LENGTH=1802 /DNA_ID=CAMNT_0005567507 /DNA_START=464 /DNA_END=5872 /DNA_ORIENTATION=-